MTYDGLIVGQTVRNLRNENHLTIEQLSEAVDKSASHIIQMELGSRKMSVDLLYSLMTAFNTDANSVLGISESKKVISIDKALMSLEESKRKYLTGIFLDMIARMPAA